MWINLTFSSSYFNEIFEKKTKQKNTPNSSVHLKGLQFMYLVPLAIGATNT